MAAAGHQMTSTRASPSEPRIGRWIRLRLGWPSESTRIRLGWCRSAAARGPGARRPVLASGARGRARSGLRDMSRRPGSVCVPGRPKTPRGPPAWVSRSRAKATTPEVPPSRRCTAPCSRRNPGSRRCTRGRPRRDPARRASAGRRAQGVGVQAGRFVDVDEAIGDQREHDQRWGRWVHRARAGAARAAGRAARGGRRARARRRRAGGRRGRGRGRRGARGRARRSRRRTSARSFASSAATVC